MPLSSFLSLDWSWEVLQRDGLEGTYVDVEAPGILQALSSEAQGAVTQPRERVPWCFFISSPLLSWANFLNKWSTPALTCPCHPLNCLTPSGLASVPAPLLKVTGDLPVLKGETSWGSHPVTLSNIWSDHPLPEFLSPAMLGSLCFLLLPQSPLPPGQAPLPALASYEMRQPVLTLRFSHTLSSLKMSPTFTPSPFTSTAPLRTSSLRSRLAAPDLGWTSTAMNSLHQNPGWEHCPSSGMPFWHHCFVLHSVPWLETLESSCLLLSFGLPPFSLQSHRRVTRSPLVTSPHKLHLLHPLSWSEISHLPLRLWHQPPTWSPLLSTLLAVYALRSPSPNSN